MAQETEASPRTAPYRSAWRETIKAAEEANDPGRFTAFIGFEWTSNTGGNNLHRNVIFRENGAKASLVEPYTTMKPLGSDNPRDLWKWLADTAQKTGSEVLAIAHNGNLSNGRMFPIIESFTGKRIDRDDIGLPMWSQKISVRHCVDHCSVVRTRRTITPSRKSGVSAACRRNANGICSRRSTPRWSSILIVSWPCWSI